MQDHCVRFHAGPARERAEVPPLGLWTAVFTLTWLLPMGTSVSKFPLLMRTGVALEEDPP